MEIYLFFKNKLFFILGTENQEQGYKNPQMALFPLEEKIQKGKKKKF